MSETNESPTVEPTNNVNSVDEQLSPASESSAAEPAATLEPTTDLAPTPDTTPPATEPTPAAQPAPKVKSSIAGGTWVALIAGALLLIVLLVFILQNQQAVELTLFAWNFTFPAGVGFLLAAIVGALIMALVGGVRMFQLRRQIRKAKKL